MNLSVLRPFFMEAYRFGISHEYTCKVYILRFVGDRAFFAQEKVAQRYCKISAKNACLVGFDIFLPAAARPPDLDLA